MLSFPVHLSSTQVFGGVHIVQFLVFILCTFVCLFFIFFWPCHCFQYLWFLTTPFVIFNPLFLLKTSKLNVPIHTRMYFNTKTNIQLFFFIKEVQCVELGILNNRLFRLWRNNTLSHGNILEIYKWENRFCLKLIKTGQ